MEDIAGWIAPIATMVAAMMTASNLGARFTGWGFVVFLVGSLAWVTVAAASGQQNLLWSNLFLTAVNIVGIWRWLGRQAKLEDGARAATERSAAVPAPTLFSAAMLQDHALAGPGGEPVGRVAGAMAECDTGRIAYLMIGEGGVAGVGERLHILPWDQVEIRGDTLRSTLSAESLRALPVVPADQWPERVPAAHD
ncbi:MAG: PRC-barrel domain containing protein [Sphingomonas bacterium]|jgi:hypothetical protein|nr:PRC-barrel domain containing protein [Sphingomonas bacterium]MDB5718533.1 PRC-barrel domain containing protein [Sphingomonas bacterium]